MATYEDLGVMRIVNADSRMTAIGGSLMPAPVIEAMAYAAKSHVSMFELQEKVGERIAALTRNEAAYVCGGAAAGIFLSILSCMTGSDPHHQHLVDCGVSRDSNRSDLTDTYAR
jgi:L-seryl-tRNA(Ser) seleniumtransferase